MGKPKIRFKGFTEEWEQRKLGDYSELITKGTTPSSFCEDGDVTFVKIEALREKRVVKELCSAISEEIHKRELARSILKEDDIVFAIAGATVGKCAVITGNILPANTNQALAIIRLKTNINRDFVYFSLTSKQMEIYINQSKSIGAQPNLSLAQMNAFEFLCPCQKEEQQKIGDYFSALDHLITLHQRKCDETKKLKKYMLQKMFPQNGMKVPEIRFEGFTGDWEQRKLGEIVERITRKNQDLVSTLPLTISAQYGLIDQNEFFDKRVASKDVSGYYLVKKGEFAYNKSTSSDAPWGAVKRLDRYENGVLSTLYIVFAINENAEIDSDYLVTYYDTDLWHRGIREIASEGARNHGLLNIAPADFFETSLSVPQDIEEQKAIGKYFTELNALITLHQRKRDELVKIKKYMLQNMFV